MGQGASARWEQAAWSCGLRAAGRALRGGGRGRDSRKEGEREGAAAALPHPSRASHICTGSLLAARRRPAQCSILPPFSRSVAPALPSEAQAPSARPDTQTDSTGDTSTRASRAGYVDCPTGAGPRDQRSSARGPGDQQGL